jgi:hypothetical protein
VCRIIHLRTLIVLSRRSLVLLCPASWLLSRLSSRCPLVLSSLRHLVFSPRLSSSSRCKVLSLHRLVYVVLPLVALPSCPLAHSHPLVVLSLRRPLAVSFCRLVDASPLVPQSSRPLIILSLHPLSSSNRAGWLLRSLLLCHRRAALSSSRHPLPAPPSRPWSTHKRLLRTFNDRQHNLRRLTEEIEFHRGWRGPHPSNHPD